MSTLTVIEKEKFDPTKPGRFVLVTQERSIQQLAKSFSDFLTSPEFINVKILHIVHAQEIVMSPLQGRAEIMYTLMAICEIPAQS